MTDQAARPGAATVVVVDDDDAVGNALKFSLEVEGFSVRLFSSPQELLDAADLAACDCFVIDQNLPGMTGLELVAPLRKRQNSAPAILITTHPSSALVERAALSNVHIVEKPLLGSALIDAIRAATRRTGTVAAARGAGR